MSNASTDLSDLILQRQWDQLGKLPGDAKATKRLAQEVKRRIALKGMPFAINPDGTLAQEQIDYADDMLTYQWDESKHKRGQPKNKGQFGPGGGGLAAQTSTPAQAAHKQNQAQQQRAVQIGGDGVMEGETAPAGKLATVVSGLQSAGAMAVHAEHVAAGYVKDKIENAISRLPAWAQVAVKNIYAVACGGTAVAFAAWTVTQNLAERVAIERGATPEEARRLRGVLASVDIAAFKPAAILTAGSAGLAAATWVIPPATGIYLAYSTARNPIKTGRAAISLVKDGLIAGVIGAGIVGIGIAEKLNFAEGADDANRGDLAADALEAHGYDDWYVAILSACLDGCPDLASAIRAADTLYKQNPKEVHYANDGETLHYAFDPKQPRDASGRWVTTLIGIVKEMGGISLSSMEALGFDVPNLKESGLGGLFRKKGGRDIEDVATELHDEGHIEIPGVVYHDEHRSGSKTVPLEAAQYVLDQLQKKAKSLHTDIDAELAKEYAAYLKEQQDAEQSRTTASRLGASPSQLEEAARSGTEDSDSGARKEGTGGAAGELAPEEGDGSSSEVDDDPIPFAISGHKQHPESLHYAHDERAHPRGDDGRWVEALGKIPHGDLHHVGGLPVRHTSPGTFRIDTDRGHVSGDAAKVAKHIGEDHGKRALHGRKRDEALKRAEAPAVLANGKAVSFVAHPNQRSDETTVFVDAKKLDASWSLNDNEYLPADSAGQGEVAGRRANFDRFLESGKPVQASRLSLHDGKVAFEDGRHRFAVLRDHGAEKVGVTVPKAQLAEIRQQFGHGSTIPQPDALAEPEKHLADAQGFAKLPKGAKVVSLHPDTHGRVGAIVKDESGRNRVQLEGTVGHGSEHVEPLDAKHSWRVPQADAPKITAGGELFNGKAQFVATPHEVPPGGSTLTKEEWAAKHGPDMNIIEGNIAGMPITTTERGLIGKVSKKTKAMLEDALSDPEILQAMKDAGIKHLQLTPHKGPGKAEHGWTMGHSNGALMFHTQTANAIEKSPVPERRDGGIKRIIHHEAGHGIWNQASGAKRAAFTDALAAHPGVTAQIAKIVNIKPPRDSWNYDEKERAASEVHSELNAMRHYDPKRYAGMPEKLRNAADAIASRKSDAPAESPAPTHKPKPVTPAQAEADTADFFRSKPEQGRLFADDGSLIIYNDAGERIHYADKESGHWITIGGAKGEDGKRHGGSPVFIDGGKITKGHPSLTGKKIGALKEAAEPSEHHKKLAEAKALPERTNIEQRAKAKAVGTHNASISRADAHQEKGYQRAVIAKKARKLGIDPAHLHSLAGEMKAHHDAHTADVTKLLQETRKHATSAGGTGSNLSHLNKAFESGDHTQIKGFDLLASQMASQYPHILGDHGASNEKGYDVDANDAAEKLFTLLQAGNPEAMSDADAYDQAFDFLAERKQSESDTGEQDLAPRKGGRKHVVSDDPIPFIGTDGILYYAADASGHEHKPAGSPEGGQFTGIGGDGTMKKAAQPGSRAAAMHAKHAELRKALAGMKQERIDTYNAVKADAEAVNEKIGEHVEELDMGDVTWDSDSEQPINDLESAISDYDADATPAERYSALKEIEAKAKEALTVKQETITLTPEQKAAQQETSQLDTTITKARERRSELYNELAAIKKEDRPEKTGNTKRAKEFTAKNNDEWTALDKQIDDGQAKQKELAKAIPDGMTDDDVATNKARFQAIITNARAARQQLRTYVAHRKEMKSIKEGNAED